MAEMLPKTVEAEPISMFMEEPLSEQQPEFQALVSLSLLCEFGDRTVQGTLCVLLFPEQQRGRVAPCSGTGSA